MPTPTYTPLANVTLGASTGTVSFNSIPNTYRDLVCVVVALGSVNGFRGRFRFNNSSTATYDYQYMAGNGTTGNAATANNQTVGWLSNNANGTTVSPLQFTINIMDYSVTDKHKTLLSRADSTTSSTEALVCRWANTAAVTSFQLLPQSGTWSAGSTFALYGVIA